MIFPHNVSVDITIYNLRSEKVTRFAFAISVRVFLGDCLAKLAVAIAICNVRSDKVAICDFWALRHYANCRSCSSWHSPISNFMAASRPSKALCRHLLFTIIGLRFRDGPQCISSTCKHHAWCVSESQYPCLGQLGVFHNILRDSCFTRGSSCFTCLTPMLWLMICPMVKSGLPSDSLDRSGVSRC